MRHMRHGGAITLRAAVALAPTHTHSPPHALAHARSPAGVTLNGEPQQLEQIYDDILLGDDALTDPPLSLQASTFALMTLFGCVVVIMCLSLVVARFSRSVNRVSESIDKAYKLKFAQQAYLSILRLRSSSLAPQPFNLVRRVVHVLGLLCSACLPQMRDVAAPHGGDGTIDQSPGADGGGDDAGDDEAGVLARYTSVTSVGVSHEGAAAEVENFVSCALSDVRLFPDAVVDYCTASEHLIVDSSQLVMRVGAALVQARRAQELEAAALRATHDEELKKMSCAQQGLKTNPTRPPGPGWLSLPTPTPPPPATMDAYALACHPTLRSRMDFKPRVPPQGSCTCSRRWCERGWKAVAPTSPMWWMRRVSQTASAVGTRRRGRCGRSIGAVSRGGDEVGVGSAARRRSTGM